MPRLEYAILAGLHTSLLLSSQPAIRTSERPVSKPNTSFPPTRLPNRFHLQPLDHHSPRHPTSKTWQSSGSALPPFTFSLGDYENMLLRLPSPLPAPQLPSWYPQNTDLISKACKGFPSQRPRWKLPQDLPPSGLSLAFQNILTTGKYPVLWPQ